MTGNMAGNMANNMSGNMAGMGMPGMANVAGMPNMAGMTSMPGMAGMPSMSGMPAMGGMANMGAMGAMGNMGNMAPMGGMSAFPSMPSVPSMTTVPVPEDGESSGSAGGGKENRILGSELVTKVMEEMPSFVTQDPRGFVLRSAVPGPLATPLLSRAKPVMKSTNTKIQIPGDSNASVRMMSIEGPLFNVCAAYMIMMRRYIEVEREVVASRGEGSGSGSGQ